jgi:hypothetical protein
MSTNQIFPIPASESDLVVANCHFKATSIYTVDTEYEGYVTICI